MAATRRKKARRRKHRWHKNPVLVRSAAWAVARGLTLWLNRTRLHLDISDPTVDPRSGHIGYIYCLWHEDLLLAAHAFRHCGIQAIISHSSDGEFITQVVKHLGFGSVRGSSRRGGSRAVLELMHARERFSLAVTPDGPLGPRREFQRGAVYVASRLQMPLVFVGLAYDRPWRSRSWDQMAFPRPFSKAVLCSSGPMRVPSTADEASLENYCQRAKAGMLAEAERADKLLNRWKRGESLTLPPPAPAERQQKCA